jgi:amino acid permease
MMVESISRAECLAKLREQGFSAPKKDALIEYDIKPEISGERTFQLFDMTSLFIGKSMSAVYKIITIACMEIFLLSYTVNFATSFAANLPIFETCSMYEDSDSCWSRYLVYAGIYIVAGISLTLKGLNESKAMNIFATVCRLGIIVLVVATSILSMMIDEPIWTDTEVQGSDASSSPLTQIFTAAPVIIDSSAFHLVLPTILAELAVKDKRNITRMITTSSSLISFVLLLMGLIVGSALNSPNIPDLCTLAWKGYTFGLSTHTWWTKMLETALMLMPALSILTNGPILAITLAENLRTEIGQVNPLLLKVGVWVLPTVASLFIWNFSTINAVLAIATYYIIYINTALVQLKSQKLVHYKSPYEGLHSRPAVAYGIIAIGAVLIGGQVVSVAAMFI